MTDKLKNQTKGFFFFILKSIVNKYFTLFTKFH